MSQTFLGYEEYKGALKKNMKGALIAMN